MPSNLQKAKEAVGSQKKPGNETQEPAGVMENRSATCVIYCHYTKFSNYLLFV